MTTDRLVDLVEAALASLGMQKSSGDEYQSPPLVLVAQFARRVSVSPLPILGRARSLVLVVRQPDDVEVSATGLAEIWRRVDLVASHRCPPHQGPSLPTTLVMIASTPIQPEEDDVLTRSLADRRGRRTVPLGLFRVHLDQQAFAFGFRRAPQGLLKEPELLAENLSPHLGRLVPLFEGEPPA